MLSPSNTDRRPQWAGTHPLTLPESAINLGRGAAFWTTVLLPVVVPLLVAAGAVAITLTTVVSFLATYCACAVLGHNHSPA